MRTIQLKLLINDIEELLFTKHLLGNNIGKASFEVMAFTDNELIKKFASGSAYLSRFTFKLNSKGELMGTNTDLGTKYLFELHGRFILWFEKDGKEWKTKGEFDTKELLEQLKAKLELNERLDIK